MRPTKQIYSHYTPEDFEVWKVLFNRQMAILEEHASKDFLKAIKLIEFTPDKIPDFKQVNKILSNKTGWGLQVVPNISPQKEFFKFLSAKKFTTTCWLRTMQQLDYLEEPDMFHDVFAHTPLLTNKAYCQFFKGIGDLALKHIHNAECIELLGRIYWFTIEFGLINENGQLKIYGAGILSSKGETENALGKTSQKLPFGVDTIMKTSYRNDVIQDTYFVIDSFAQLMEALPKIEKKLALVDLQAIEQL